MYIYICVCVFCWVAAVRIVSKAKDFELWRKLAAWTTSLDESVLPSHSPNLQSSLCMPYLFKIRGLLYPMPVSHIVYIS